LSAPHQPSCLAPDSRSPVIDSDGVSPNDAEPGKPPPTFQGYRILTIQDNTITRIQHIGQSATRKLRGWGRRTVTRLAQASAGTVSDVKLVKVDDTRLVSVVRGGAGQLLLISWAAQLGPKEPGTLTRTGSIEAGRASDLDVVKAGTFLVTACRNDAGKLLLISWRVASNGAVTRAIEGVSAGEARLIRLTALSSNLLVTACQDGSGNLLLISWRVGTNGSITRLSDSGNSAKEISDLEMIKTSNGRVVTAARAGSKRLLLISWEITAANGNIRRLVDSGNQAGELDVTGTGPAPVLPTGIAAALDNLGRVAVSVRAADGRLKLILWEIASNGQIRRRADAAGQAGKIRQHTLTAVPSTGDRSVLVSAVTTEAGTLKLITWDITREGAIRRVAQTGGEAGEAASISVVTGALVNTIPAVGLGSSFPIVTAMRAGNGDLLLISWRAKAQGQLTTPVPLPNPGAVSSILT